MTNSLKNLRKFMTENDLSFFVVPSTDEYLNEYNELSNNARFAITNFSGSTGDAIVTHDNVYLFVDGRYHKQADDEVDNNTVTVVKLDISQPMKQSLFDKLEELSSESAKVGIIGSKTSFKDFKKLDEKKLNLIEYNSDIVLDLAKDKNKKNTLQTLNFVPIEISGKSSDEKLEFIANQLKTETFIITKLEEIAYLTNLRSFQIPFSSSLKAKAVISFGKCYIFADIENLEKIKSKFSEKFEFLPENAFGDFVKKLDKSTKIGLDFGSITLKTYRELENTGCELIETASPIAEMKAIKTEAEINHMKECFLCSDIVLNRVICWVRQSLDKGEIITEKDLSDKVTQYFNEQGAFGLSFNTIASADKNTAIIHYGNPRSEKIIADGSLVLLDFGGYFDGGYATDCTRSFLASKQDTPATDEQKFIYTSVLRGILHGLNVPITPETSGFDIDSKVREIVNQNLKEGFAFSHGTGHGVGISVHEFPPSISSSELAKTPLKAGTVFTIEPGLYNQNWGGVRLENTVYIQEKNGSLSIKTLVKYNFDKKLINYEMLSHDEKNWLSNYQKSAIG